MSLTPVCAWTFDGFGGRFVGFGPRGVNFGEDFGANFGEPIVTVATGDGFTDGFGGTGGVGFGLVIAGFALTGYGTEL